MDAFAACNTTLLVVALSLQMQVYASAYDQAFLVGLGTATWPGQLRCGGSKAVQSRDAASRSCTAAGGDHTRIYYFGIVDPAVYR